MNSDCGLALLSKFRYGDAQKFYYFLLNSLNTDFNEQIGSNWWILPTSKTNRVIFEVSIFRFDVQ